MAQDTRKSSFSVESASTEARSFPTISLTTIQAGTTSSEDAEVSQNPEASKQLEVLSRKGLNPLKPVIIANTEFVPVGDGSSPDSTGLKAQLGDNNLLSVNSVTKLFEIHRQIRLATINSAEHLINRIKGFDSKDILDELNRIISSSIDSLAGDNLEDTVDAVIDRIVNFQSASSNSSTQKTKRRKGASARENQKKSLGGSNNSTLIGSSIEKRAEVRSIFENNRNDPYLRTLIEYAVLEYVVYDMIKYLSGILSLKDAAANSWSIFESLGYNKISEIFTDNFNDSAKVLLSYAQRSFSISDMALENAGSGRDLVSQYTGIKTTSSTSDITLLLQFFIQNAQNLLRMSSNYEEVISDEVKSPFYTGVLPNLNKDIPHVYNALKILSEAWAITLFSKLEIDGNRFYYLGGAALSADENGSTIVTDSVDANKNFFGTERIQNIFESFSRGENVDKLGEMLSASILNDCFHLAGVKASAKKKNSIFYSINAGIPTNIRHIEDYFLYLLNYNNRENSSFFDFTLKKSEKSRQEKIVQYFFPKDSSSEDLSSYIPFESTSNLSKKIYTSNYLTGPEYFYDIALQRGDVSLKDLKKFSESYQEFASNYVSDIYNLTKIDYAELAMKKLLSQIGDELMSSAREGDNVFLLALIANQASSPKGLLRLFRSVYFASMLNSKDDSDGHDIGKNDASPFYKHEDSTQEQGARRVMRVANTVLIRTLFKNSFGIKESDLKTEQKDSVRRLSGEKQSNAFRPKEYTEKDDAFSNIKEGISLNAGTGENIGRKISYTIRKQSGKKQSGGYRLGGLNKEETLLEGGANFSTRLCQTIKYFLKNQHFEDCGLVSEEERINFNRNRRDAVAKDDNGESIDKGPTAGMNFQGVGVSLASHHRAFILYSFIAKIIQKSCKVRAVSYNTDDSNDARIVISMNADEIEGVAQAFKDFGDDTPGTANRSSRTSEWPEAKKIAYDNTSDHLSNMMESLSRRIRKISVLTIAPMLHSSQIYNQWSVASKFIQEGGGTARDRLAISILKSDKIKAFDNSLTLLSEESASQMYKSYVSTILRGNSSYTREDMPNVIQMKLMMKILTHAGYGLLSSEKRGPKNICHVGVTNSLLKTLRIEAFKEFNNREFLESNRFCVNIFKRNEIDASILVYPKTFLFDSSLMLLDNDHEGRSLNHISNFSDSWSFNDILNNMEFSSWTDKDNTFEDNPFENLKSNYRIRHFLGSELRNDLEDVLINHIFDYAFKIYYRYALGIDLNENTFSLESIRKNINRLPGGITVSDRLIQEDYANLINQTRLLYPAANVNQKLASELFRAIEIIAAHPGYDLTNKIKKAIYPKKFDKVLSILVNEKDFVLYTDAYSKNFSDIYKTEPIFSYTSRQSRPDPKLTSSEYEKTINKYISECDEDFPEIFSMYATITMLPKGSK